MHEIQIEGTTFNSISGSGRFSPPAEFDTMIRTALLHDVVSRVIVIESLSTE